MTVSTKINLSRYDVSFIKNALESVQAELEQLERDEEWYVSEVTDLVASSLEIVYGALGIKIEDLEDFNDDEYDDY